MAIEPDHLIELARRIANSGKLGAPRKTDLRRAVSAAYYAVFHQTCWEIQTAFAAGDSEASKLFYRSLDHKAIGKLGKPTISPDFQKFTEPFATLQKERVECDYNPDKRITKDEVERFIKDAETAIGCLRQASPDKRSFLARLILKSR